MGLEGKTIARVVELGYDGAALIFTDGSAAHFVGGGYEDSACDYIDVTEMDVIRLEAVKEDDERRTAIQRARTIARRELKERIKRNVSPSAWLNWQRVHVSPMESMCDAMCAGFRRDMNRTLHGGFSVIGKLA